MSALLNQHQDTLLTCAQVAPLIAKTPKTVRVDVTRAPEGLPAITRIGRNVRFRVGDVIEFIRSRTTPRPEPLRARVRKELRAK